MLNPSTDPDYNGKVNSPDAEYPNGSARDAAVENDPSATPLLAKKFNDDWGFDAALLAAAGLSASGDPDTAEDSQRLAALVALFGRPTFPSFADLVTAAQGGALDGVDQVGTVQHTSGGIGGDVFVKNGLTGTPNENLYDGGTFNDANGDTWVTKNNAPFLMSNFGVLPGLAAAATNAAAILKVEAFAKARATLMTPCRFEYEGGLFASTDPLPFIENTKFSGQGEGITTLTSTTSKNVVGVATTAAPLAYCGLSDLTIDGRSSLLPFPSDDEDGNALRLNQVSFSDFENLEIKNSIFNAVSIYNNSNDNMFSNLRISAVGKAGTLPAVWTMCGVFFEAGSSRNKIKGMWVNGARQYGVWVGARDADNRDNSIEDAWIAQTDADGVHIGDEATANKCIRPSLTNVNILAAGDFGLRAFHAGTGAVEGLTVNGGTVEDCVSGGVLLDTACSGSMVDGVVIKNNGATGVIDAGTDNTLGTNTVTGHATNLSLGSATRNRNTGSGETDGRTNPITPSVLFGGSSAGVTYSSQEGFMSVSGGVCRFGVRIVLTSKGSSTGPLTIGGLTFPNAPTGALGVPSLAVANVTFSGAPFGLILNNATEVSIFQQQSGSPTSPLTDADVSDTSEFYLEGSYKV
ncbi:hypothetical protein [Shewanella phage SFCi1]|nr:hypothetical protein [Shewanella phage SFCi1]